MTLASTTSRTNIILVNNTLSYSYTFKILSSDDLLVTLADADGLETVVTNYTVSGVGALSGGSILFAADPYDSGYRTGTIRRVRDVTQETDIRNNGVFYPSTHEDTFDHMIMVDQQQQDEINRSVKLQETDHVADFETDLPADIIGSVSLSLVTNATGDGFAMGPSVSTIEGAVTAAAAAAVSAAAALVSEDNAEDWATLTTGIVEATDYSAKAYAIGGVGVTDTATKGAAKEWAIEMVGTVDGTDFSAKYHAAAAAQSAIDAAAAAAAAADASAFEVYADDAAYVTAKGSAAANGDVYYNSTDHLVKVYRNGAWGSSDRFIRGTRGVPTAIVAGTGVVASSYNETQFVEGSGGAVDISANPQISAGTFVGQELTLIGRSDTNTVLLEHGTGLELNGSCTLIAGSVIKLIYDGTSWTEVCRNDL